MSQSKVHRGEVSRRTVNKSKKAIGYGQGYYFHQISRVRFYHITVGCCSTRLGNDHQTITTHIDQVQVQAERERAKSQPVSQPPTFVCLCCSFVLMYLQNSDEDFFGVYNDKPRTQSDPRISDELSMFLEHGLDGPRNPTTPVAPLTAVTEDPSVSMTLEDLDDLRQAAEHSRANKSTRDQKQTLDDGGPIPSLEMAEDEMMAQLDELDAYDYHNLHPGLLEEYARSLQRAVEDERRFHEQTKQGLVKKVKEIARLTYKLSKKDQRLKQLEAQLGSPTA